MWYSRELALAISLVSLGSNQTLFLPHLSTAAANRFCNRSVLKFITFNKVKQSIRQFCYRFLNHWQYDNLSISFMILMHFWWNKLRIIRICGIRNKALPHCRQIMQNAYASIEILLKLKKMTMSFQSVSNLIPPCERVLRNDGS